MPYDQFVRELLTAKAAPSTTRRPITSARPPTPTTAPRRPRQLFLGIRIQCAKCHNHPFERWTQDNYYGIGAFFNRVQRKKSVSPDEMVIYVAAAAKSPSRAPASR